MSFQNNFKLRLNTNISTLSSSDIRLILKNLYEELETLKIEVAKFKTQTDKQENETRNISQDRPKVGRTSGKDVPTT